MDTGQWPQKIVVKPMEEIVVVTGGGTGAAGAATPNNTNTCSSSAAAVAAGGVGADLAGAVVSHNHGQQQRHQHQQGGGGGGEEINGGGISNSKQTSTSMERKIRPTKDQAVNCPRCNSTNTKFCYYNNYSLTQPRYFCKTCRRYWTEGGSLRNIPVGGGSRKNKRPSSALAVSSNHHSAGVTATTGVNKMCKLPDLVVNPSTTNLLNHPSSYPNPKNFLHHHEGSQDLNLGFSTPNNSATRHQDYRGLCEFIQLPSSHMETPTTAPKTSSLHLTSTMNVPHYLNPGGQHHQVSALELITGLASARGGLASFMPMSIADPNSIYSGGYPLQLQQQHPADFKPGTLSFNLDGLGNGGGPAHGDGGYGGNLQDGMGGKNANNSSSHDNTNRSGTGRLLFPFEDLKQEQQQQRGTSATTTTTTNDKHNNSTSTTDHNSSEHQHQQQHQDHSRDHHDQGVPAGYWSGMLGNGAATGSW